MSWNIQTNVIRKENSDAALQELTIPEDSGAARDQLAAAKRAAKELLKTVPGPFIRIRLSGHANGVGWQKKDGYANDTITVTVDQLTSHDKM